MRNPIVSGSFYPQNKKQLQDQINESINSADISKILQQKTYGVVVPHAGYNYSGKCAGYAYSQIKQDCYDTFIVLGTNHTGYAESDFAVCSQDFKTPLGICHTDGELLKEIIELGKNRGIFVGETEKDKLAHKNEHSIEVQIPFIQTISNRSKILPIICKTGEIEKQKSFASIIIEASKKMKREIFIIASSDLTHFGFSYGFTPFHSSIKENLHKMDLEAVSLITKFKSKEFLDYANETTICGSNAISTCIEICKALGSKNAKLLNYYTSADLSDDYSASVGYASIAFS
ncbi:MAG: AmmeMemoRadiSam system protein B [archaeon]